MNAMVDVSTAALVIAFAAYLCSQTIKSWRSVSIDKWRRRLHKHSLRFTTSEIGLESIEVALDSIEVALESIERTDEHNVMPLYYHTLPIVRIVLIIMAVLAVLILAVCVAVLFRGLNGDSVTRTSLAYAVISALVPGLLQIVMIVYVDRVGLAVDNIPEAE